MDLAQQWPWNVDGWLYVKVKKSIMISSHELHQYTLRKFPENTASDVSQMNLLQLYLSANCVISLYCRRSGIINPQQRLSIYVGRSVFGNVCSTNAHLAACPYSIIPRAIVGTNPNAIYEFTLMSTALCQCNSMYKSTSVGNYISPLKEAAPSSNSCSTFAYPYTTAELIFTSSLHLKLICLVIFIRGIK